MERYRDAPHLTKNWIVISTFLQRDPHRRHLRYQTIKVNWKVRSALQRWHHSWPPRGTITLRHNWTLSIKGPVLSLSVVISWPSLTEIRVLYSVLTTKTGETLTNRSKTRKASITCEEASRGNADRALSNRSRRKDLHKLKKRKGCHWSIHRWMIKTSDSKAWATVKYLWSRYYAVEDLT